MSPEFNAVSPITFLAAVLQSGPPSQYHSKLRTCASHGRSKYVTTQ